MGRYAQQRMRGSDAASQPGLPPGPTLADFDVVAEDGSGNVYWTGPEHGAYNFWRSRWRIPSVSMLWSLSVSDIQPTTSDTIQTSPLAYEEGYPQDCEVIYCDVAGNVMTQWSPYKST